MAQNFSSVVLVGATGNVGPLILTALRDAQPPIKSITVLTRQASTHDPGAYPSDIQVKKVDYSSHESLVSALTGADAVISAVATQSTEVQKAIVDAAVAARVKFFIPSEYGLASNNPRLNQDFPIWAEKVRFQEYLATLKKEGKIDYTLVFTGLFLDWGMSGFLLDLQNRKVELWDGGKWPISMTSMPSIGKAVVSLLQGKANGKTEVRIKDINITQSRLFELATEVVGKEGWEVTTLDTKEASMLATKKLADGTASLDDIYSFVKRAVMGEQYDMPWSADEDDSVALGLKPWTEDDVRILIREIAASE